MAKRVYACRNKGNADKAFRTSGRGSTSLSEKKLELEAKRSQAKHRSVQISGPLAAWSPGSTPPFVTAQVVQLNSSGNYVSQSIHDNSQLPTVVVYSKSTISKVATDVIDVEWHQGNWWYVEKPADPTPSTGYGALASDLAGTDITASVALDSASPLEPSTTVSAINWVGMDGVTGAKCIVSKSGTQYILIQLACPEETP